MAIRLLKGPVGMRLKATVRTDPLATIAIYDIHQPAQYFKNNFDGTFTEVVGESQHDRGIELKLTGKLWDDPALGGGFNFMNLRRKRSRSAILQGQIPDRRPT